MTDETPRATAAERLAAVRSYASPSISIEPDPQVLRTAVGVWVQAWVWVDAEDIGQPAKPEIDTFAVPRR